MKYIKKFEGNIPGIEIGDYVAVTSNVRGYLEKGFAFFLKDNFGKLLKISYNNSVYFLEFENIPPHLASQFAVSIYDPEIPKPYEKGIRDFSTVEIIDFAKTKEELKLKLQMSKYNL